MESGDWSKAGEPKIAYLVGGDDHTGIVRDSSRIDVVGSTDIYQLRVRGPSDFARLHVTKGYFRQPQRYTLDTYDVLLNLVTDPDQNPRVLENLTKMLKGYRGRVINPPDLVLRTTRDRIAKAFQGLPNVIAPRTIRLKGNRPLAVRQQLEGAGIRFPAILRLTGTHTGRVLGLVDSVDQLIPLLVEGKEHFLTEFVDFWDADGLFRKNRFFFIGGEIIFRHRLISDAWNVHAADRNRFMSPRPDLIEEERELIARGISGLPESVRAGLNAIRGAVGLDYFGLDCAISAKGEIILFESNATMNFLPFVDDPKFNYVKACLRPAQEAFHKMLFGKAPVISRA